jgi:predicted enzyme related to lactoylglutathione lyase
MLSRAFQTLFLFPEAAMLLGLRTVVYNYSAEQLTPAKEWYTKVVGAAPHWDTPYYVGFNVGGFELGLHPDKPAGPGGTVAYWGTADIVAEVARLKGIGAVELGPIQDVGGGIKVATLSDPFGNLFGVIENPQFDKTAVK